MIILTDKNLIFLSTNLTQIFFSMSSSDGSRGPTPAVGLDGPGGRISVASRRFTPAPQAAADDHMLDGPDDQPADLPEQTTLLHDEEESFALAPVDASAFKGKFQ